MRQNSDQPVEQIITEALRRELESITPPPPDQIWQRVSSRLSQTTRREQPSFPWRRAVATAAAVLVLAAGVAGLYRSPWLTFQRWDAAGRDQVEESGDFLITAEQEPGDSKHMPFEGDRRTCPEVAALEPPAGLAESYQLEAEIVLPEDEIVGLQGVLYTGPGVKLLWIRREPPAENPERLLSEVESAFKVSYSILTPGERRLTVEDSAGNPGLVVRDSACDQLLLVIEGQFTEAELWSILKQ